MRPRIPRMSAATYELSGNACVLSPLDLDLGERQAMPVIPLKGFLREAGLSGYEYALRVRAPCSGAC